MALPSDTVSDIYNVHLYQTTNSWMPIVICPANCWLKDHNQIFLQWNPSFWEMLDQVHFSWKVTKYDFVSCGRLQTLNDPHRTINYLLYSDECVDLRCSVDRSTKCQDCMSLTPLYASLDTSLPRRTSSLSALQKISKQLFSIYCKVHRMKRWAFAY